ncbi:MAG TPA: protein-L-isoaspartate O-methyltransferase [Xanthobacteraceae bacterium]|jgi:protein-L-isoaspartate(D-aspartate) O-methyltransferase
MTDFTAARRSMVDGQVRTSDVTDLRLIAALLEVPREHFVPRADAALAYLDRDIPLRAPGVSPGRYLLKPMVLAKMVQAANVRATDHVLDVGCTTGYSAALLGRLAGSVVALEEDPALAAAATENLKQLGSGKVEAVKGPLAQGFAPRAPYDLVFLDGASEIEPRSLFAQLRDQGRLVAVVGRPPAARAMLYRSVGADVSGWPVFDAAAPVLPGFAAPVEFVF